MKYRETTNYKYQTVEDFSIPVKIYPKLDIHEPNPENPFLKLSKNGRGSLVHDALYQLMRQNKISLEYREYADELLKKLCLEDGMSSFRAEYVFRSVRYFGESSAKPSDKTEQQEKILEAP